MRNTSGKLRHAIPMLIALMISSSVIEYAFVGHAPDEAFLATSHSYEYSSNDTILGYTSSPRTSGHSRALLLSHQTSDSLQKSFNAMYRIAVKSKSYLMSTSPWSSRLRVHDGTSRQLGQLEETSLSTIDQREHSLTIDIERRVDSTTSIKDGKVEFDIRMTSQMNNSKPDTDSTSTSNVKDTDSTSSSKVENITKQIIRGTETYHMDANETKWQTQNYFQMAMSGHFAQADRFGALKVLFDYISRHSQQQLEKKWAECGNKPCQAFDDLKFVVGRYACPLEAGNRLVRMMNSLLWALLTDRVFLSDYWTEATCIQEVAREDTLTQSLCNSTFFNSPDDCSAVLKMADWVPSWQEWSVKLNLTPPERAYVVGRRSHDEFAFPMDGSRVPRVIHVGQQVNLEAGVKVSKLRNGKGGLLQEKKSLRTAWSLFSNGLFFCYGALFESLFTLDPSLAPAPELLYSNSAVDSYVMHSRHEKKRVDGSNTKIEMACLKELIAKRLDPTRPCIVYGMTDRAITKTVLPKAFAKLNCTVVFSSNTTQGASWNSEHGPFAGRGYFEDLALVRSARAGFSAPNTMTRLRVGLRTSSAIPRSMIEFRRLLEASPETKNPPFQECIVPK